MKTKLMIGMLMAAGSIFAQPHFSVGVNVNDSRGYVHARVDTRDYRSFDRDDHDRDRDRDRYDRRDYRAYDRDDYRHFDRDDYGRR